MMDWPRAAAGRMGLPVAPRNPPPRVVSRFTTGSCTVSNRNFWKLADWGDVSGVDLAAPSRPAAAGDPAPSCRAIPRGALRVEPSHHTRACREQLLPP